MYRQGMPFTEEDIQRARSVSLLGYLESCGMKLTRKGRYYCLKEHDSLVINPDTNKWHWNSHGKHGVNAVDFIMAYDNRSFLDAVAELIGKSPGCYTRAPTPEDLPEKKDFALPSPSANMRRIYAYLTKTRCIDAAVVTHFVRAKTLYEDEHHNCVFVGCNEQGHPVYGFQRGTLTDHPYRGDCPDSDKRYNFCHVGTGSKLYVFEASIDLLSYLSLHQEWDSNFLSLGGLSDVALRPFLHDHSHVNKIVLCLDNDVPGIYAAERLRQKYREQYTVEIKSPGGADVKDWNARLVLERRGIVSPKKASCFKGGTNTLVVFSRPEDVRQHLECNVQQNDSLLLIGDNPENEIAAFQKMFFEERRLAITNIKTIPTEIVG